MLQESTLVALRTPIAARLQPIYFEVHHVNGDPTDNRIRNLIPLCRDCHHEATFPGI